MQKIYTVQEAENWFISHSSGGVIAVNESGKEKECFDFPTAVHWINGTNN